MVSRRNMFIGLTAGAVASAASGRGIAQDASRAAGGALPYRSARHILAQALPRIDHGARSASDVAAAVHDNFPQIVEQNFARLGRAPFERMFVELSDLEFQGLAGLYMRACMQQARAPHLLDLFAERLDAGKLARLAPHFGSEPLWAALRRTSPEKAQDFAQALSVPEASARIVGPAVPPAALAGPTIDYTIYEIYLSYRTAPIGALSVKAALYETAMFTGRYLVAAWGIGYAVGTALASVTETYAPGLWNSIGGTVHTVVQSLSSAFDWVGQAAWQVQGAATYGLTSFESMMMESTGGDYAVVYAWYQIRSGGTEKCGSNQWCPPWDPHVAPVN